MPPDLTFVKVIAFIECRVWAAPSSNSPCLFPRGPRRCHGRSWQPTFLQTSREGIRPGTRARRDQGRMHVPTNFSRVSGAPCIATLSPYAARLFGTLWTPPREIPTDMFTASPASSPWNIFAAPRMQVSAGIRGSMGRGLPIGVPAEVSTHRCVPPASDLKAPPNSKASQTRMSSPPNAGHRPPSACVSLGIRSGVSSHEEFAAWPSPESLPRTCPPPLLTPSLLCPSPCFCTRKKRA